jgi:hypothetical protein
VGFLGTATGLVRAGLAAAAGALEAGAGALRLVSRLLPGHGERPAGPAPERPLRARPPVRRGTREAQGTAVRLTPVEPTTAEEPWEGYARMRAADVQRSLRDASPEALAAVRLYESTHKNRRTVLSAVDRRLRARGGR